MFQIHSIRDIINIIFGNSINSRNERKLDIEHGKIDDESIKDVSILESLKEIIIDKFSR